MPTYVYRCPECQRTSEQQHKMGEQPKVICVRCSRAMSKVIQPVGIAFRGSGFYVNDYGRSRGGET
jgi:putative FmdB family regulatory protein